MDKNFNSLSPKTLATAAVEKVHNGFAIYPELLNCTGVQKLLQEARSFRPEKWDPIFNPDKLRRVATAGTFGRKVALWIHHFLTKDACILDEYHHAVELIQHENKTASFLRSLPGCGEQAPHRDFSPWNCTINRSRFKPLSCIVFLKNATNSSGSRIKIWRIDEAGNTVFEIMKGNAGDLLVFEGDYDCFCIVHVFNIFWGEVIHNGMDSDEENYRLFFYCPTRENQVSWSFIQAQVKTSLQVKDAKTLTKLDSTFN